VIGWFEWITRILDSFQRYLALFAVRAGTIGQRVKSVRGIKITIASKSRRRWAPFLSVHGDKHGFIRFFSRSSVTFGSVEWAKGTGGTDAHASQKSNHERHELHERPRNRIEQQDPDLI